MLHNYHASPFHDWGCAVTTFLLPFLHAAEAEHNTYGRYSVAPHSRLVLQHVFAEAYSPPSLPP